MARQIQGAAIDRMWRNQLVELGIDRSVREIERWRLEGKLLPPNGTPAERLERHLRLLDRLTGRQGFRGSSFRWLALVLGGFSCPCEGLRQALMAACGLDSLDELPMGRPGSMESHEQVESIAAQVASQSEDSGGSTAKIIRGITANLRRMRRGPDNVPAIGLTHVLLEDVASVALTGQPPPLGIDEHLISASIGLAPPAEGGLPLATRQAITAASDRPPILSAVELVTHASLERLAGPIPLVKIILERVALPLWGVTIDDADEIAALAAALTPGFVCGQPGFFALVDALGGIDVVTKAIESTISYDPVKLQQLLFNQARLRIHSRHH